MNHPKTTTIVVILCSLFTFIQVNGQCMMSNSAFTNGEEIKYDLYMKMGIITAPAGKGSLTVTEANYRGKDAYKIVMMLNTSGLAGNIYTVNDTLTSYIDKNLRPLLFIKEAFEGKDYTEESQSYTYEEGKINIRAYRVMNGEEKFDEVVTTDQCTYDYLSVLSYIRNLDYSDMKPGDRKHIRFISGRKPVNMYVNYLGISTVKANDDKKYEVINISLTVLDEAFENQKDALKASITNDKNRIPVIIDTTLKIGTIRAVLRNVTGEKH